MIIANVLEMQSSLWTFELYILFLAHLCFSQIHPFLLLPYLSTKNCSSCVTERRNGNICKQEHVGSRESHLLNCYAGKILCFRNFEMSI